MEFGIFTNMYHPKHWRDGKVRTEHETLRNELEYIELVRPGRLQVLVVGRAPLPRRVLPPLGVRELHGLRHRPHAEHPRGLGDHEHHRAGEPPGPHRRAGRDARPPERGPVRVRHRPGLVVDRGVRLRHRVDGPHPRALRRVAAPDRAHVGRGRLLLRGRQLLDAHPPGAAQALHRPAPADLGGGRLAGHVREGGPARHRRAVLHPRHPRHAGAARSRSTRTTSTRPSRSATT